MKNICSLVISIVVVLFGGPTAVSAERDPAGFKIPSAEKRAQINAKFAANQINWRRELGLSCPLGGYERVEISSQMGGDISHMKYGGLKSIFVRAIGVNRVKNPYTNITLDISEDTGYVVKNLCPGGSITLVKSMDPNLFRYSQYERYHWIAEGMLDGRLAYGYIGAMTLDSWQGLYERVRKEPPWLIKLDRVDKEF